jgi:hypothetical protein
MTWLALFADEGFWFAMLATLANQLTSSEIRIRQRC